LGHDFRLGDWNASWQQWARWGRILQSSTDLQAQAPDSKPLLRVAEAFRKFAESETSHLQQLLHLSDERLTPLSDPLWLSSRDNRWLDLRREREESYTDWLAWLLTEMCSKQLCSADSMLKIFGLDGKEFGAQVRGSQPRLIREKSITTSDGEKKRLDLVIRFGDVGILLVEVKVRSIDEAGGRKNLPVYLKWLNSQESAARCAVLLVPASIDVPCDDWKIRTWDGVSLALRAQASALQKATPNSLLPALLLCFAGSVEQNLLGLSATTKALAAPQTALYLERFLEKDKV
jgi:hypothetical protein